MTLDNPALTGRRSTTYARRSTYERRVVVAPRATTWDVRPATRKMIAPLGRSSAAAVPRRASDPAPSGAAAPEPGVHRVRSLRQKLPMVLAIVLFVFGLGVGVTGLSANHRAVAQIRHLSQNTAPGGTSGGTGADANAAPSDVPSETSNTANIDDYHVAASAPRVLTISKLGVKARVLRTTVNSQNVLGTPNNIFDTAWYADSAKPGEAGAMLIDGHVSGPTQSGVFYNLKKLVAGDKITVERGDGKIYTYSVVMSKTYDADKVDMAAALTPVTSGKSGLNLITCAGKLDASGTHFQQRTIVFAAQD